MSTKPRGRIGGNRSDRNGTARNGINRNGTGRNRINRNGTGRNRINRNGTDRNGINRNGIYRNGTDRNRQKSRRAKSVLKAVILLEMLAIGVVVYALRLSMRAGGNDRQYDRRRKGQRRKRLCGQKGQEDFGILVRRKRNVTEGDGICGCTPWRFWLRPCS